MKTENHGALAGEEIISICERIEKLKEDIACINSDIRDILHEAKIKGYDPKYIRYLLKLRKLDPDELDEADELAVMYRKAVGMDAGIAENA